MKHTERENPADIQLSYTDIDIIKRNRLGVLDELGYQIFYIFSPVLKMRHPNLSLLIGTSIAKDILNGITLYCKVRILTVNRFCFVFLCHSNSVLNSILYFSYLV